jgi:predicted amidohydrolase YtcJ
MTVTSGLCYSRAMPPPAAPLAFTGGRILTMDPGRREVETLVVDGGRVAAAGDRAILAGWPGCEVVDLAGRIVVPGFIDAHNHLSLVALQPRWADLTAATGVEDLGRALREQAAREPDAEWVRGFGWEQAGDWPEMLRRSDLDALGLDRPVIVTHFSLHMCVVCSRGLELLGIGRHTPDPDGGVIERDAHGEPTGLLVERAWSRAHAESLAAYRDPDRWDEHLLARMRVLLSEGVTCVHDAATAPAAEAAYRRLATAGRLPLSVLAMPHPAAILSGPAADRLEGPPTGDGDEWFRVGPIKLFADGGSHPAIDAHRHGERFTSGIAFPGLAAGVAAASARGFRVAVHAMGNVGLGAALAAFEAVTRTDDGDHRFRVEHATLASDGQLRRLAELGGVAVVQPGFLSVVGRRVSSLGFDDVTWMPFADLVAAGVPLAASSDDPCGAWEPLDTSRYGATRSTGHGTLGPDQAVGYEEWLRYWTAGSAYAGGQEDERGRLVPGARADLVILDGELDPDRPPTVAETWVAGRRRHPDG